MLVFCKIWIKRNPKKAVLLFAEDLDFGDGSTASCSGIDAVDLALEFDEKDRAVGRKIESHGAGEVFCDGFGLKAESIHSVNKAGESKGEDEPEK